jgi:hypothetical protein
MTGMSAGQLDLREAAVIFWRNVKYALGSLAGAKGFTITMVLTLARNRSQRQHLHAASRRSAAALRTSNKTLNAASGTPASRRHNRNGRHTAS